MLHAQNANVRQTKPAHRVLEKAYEMGGFELQAKIAEKLYAVCPSALLF